MVVVVVIPGLRVQVGFLLDINAKQIRHLLVHTCKYVDLSMASCRRMEDWCTLWKIGVPYGFRQGVLTQTFKRQYLTTFVVGSWYN